MTITQASATFAANQYELVKQTSSVSSITGRKAWTREYKCTQTGVDNLIASGALAGSEYIANWEPGGGASVTATYPFDPSLGSGGESPEENWYYSEVPTQPSIWTHPVVAPLLIANPDAKVEIEEAIRLGNVSPTYPPDTALGQVYLRLLRGTDSWEAMKPIIRRSRQFSVEYAPRAVIEISTPYYTRASLISTFNAPPSFQPQIPVDPSWSAPSGTRWGWKRLAQQSGINRQTNRYDETIEWEGGFWDTALYTLL